MAVLGRNRTLSRCTFRPRYRVQSTVAQRTSIKAGAHMHCVDLSGIHASLLRVLALPSTEVLCYSVLNAERDRNMQRNNVRFLPGIATLCLKILNQL